jgi:calcium-dependent protein kinase
MGTFITPEEVDEIIRSVDTDNSGFIEFDEFIVAAINKNQLYSKENLMKAFNQFDRDSSGTISVDEIKNVIGVDLAEDEVWT